MDDQLTNIDFDVILESLKYSKLHIENYEKYPSYEFKQEQLKRITDTEQRVKALRDKSGK